MPRSPNFDRPASLHLKLPETVRAKLDLHLFSDVEGRVPQGKYQEFFIERIGEYFDGRRLDLAPFGFPNGFYVTGQKDMIDLLERRLRDDNV